MNTKPYVLLVAVDLEIGSQFVLHAALQMAHAHAPTDVHVVTVASPIVAVGNELAAAPFVAVSGVDTAGLARMVKETVDGFFGPPPHAADIRVTAHAAVGSPADEIVWLAAHLDADRIVVGTHNRKGISRVLLGSVAEKVTRLAGCEVTVVREKSHVSDARTPEIEPLCADCAKARQTSGGAQLWCQRHSEHHVQAHLYSSANRGPDAPPAWSSMTGT